MLISGYQNLNQFEFHTIETVDKLIIGFSFGFSFGSHFLIWNMCFMNRFFVMVFRLEKKNCFDSEKVSETPIR